MLTKSKKNIKHRKLKISKTPNTVCEDHWEENSERVPTKQTIITVLTLYHSLLLPVLHMQLHENDGQYIAEIK